MNHLPESEYSGSNFDREYRQMLQRLCILAKVPSADHTSVINNEAMMLGEVPLTFRLEEWSGFVKVYVTVGVPDPARIHDVYRHLLEQQLTLPAPFSMISGVDPNSNNIILYGCAPLATDAQMDEEFFAFLHGCVYAAELLKPSLT